MDTKRETKEFVTSGGNKIEYKSYITLREFNEIQAVYLKDTKFNMIGKDVKMEGFSPSVEFDAKKKLIEIAIVSFDGSTEDVVEKILDLPFEQGNEVLAVLDEISSKKK